MLKFFYSTATASTPCHIAFEESGLKYTPVQVGFKEGVNVAELEKVNPLGRVPAILNENGQALTQNAAILEYIADLNPSSQLLAKAGTWERAETLAWVSFAASDFNKIFPVLFQAEKFTADEQAQAEIKKFAVESITEYLLYVDKSLAGKDFIMGQQFTIADCYLFTMLGWCTWAELNLTEYRHVTSYMKRVYNRPAVQKVLKAEDLLDFVQ